jgi:hypothetical protein
MVVAGALAPDAFAESPERQAAEICSYAEDIGTLSAMKRSRVDRISAIIGPRTPDTSVVVNTLCAVAQIRAKTGAAEPNQCVRLIQELVTGA